MLVVINCPGHFTSTNPISISSSGANISSKALNIRFYSGHVTLGNLAREELLWWIENLKLCNGRKIQQRESHMIIQTDASTKGWGHIAKEFLQGGMVKEEAFSHKCSRITGIKIYNPNFHKELVTLDYSCLSGQQSCPGISLEDGWYLQYRAFENQQVNLELSIISSDHNYCKAPSK